jgi:hypothetical protein
MVPTGRSRSTSRRQANGAGYSERHMVEVPDAALPTGHAERPAPTAGTWRSHALNNPVDLDGFPPTDRHYANSNHVVRVTCSKCRGKQLLTMRFGAGASAREIARGLGVAPSTVREYLSRAAAAEIGWPLGGGRHRREPDGAAVRQRGCARRRAVLRRA